MQIRKQINLDLKQVIIKIHSASKNTQEAKTMSCYLGNTPCQIRPKKPWRFNQEFGDCKYRTERLSYKFGASVWKTWTFKRRGSNEERLSSWKVLNLASLALDPLWGLKFNISASSLSSSVCCEWKYHNKLLGYTFNFNYEPLHVQLMGTVTFSLRVRK